jgi:uncharacterized protein (TIGR02246 family)
MITQMKNLTILLSIFVFLASVATAQTAGNDRDLQLIKNIETNWQDAWNRHDMKALAALVAEDVDFIAVGGTWLKNRKDFEEHHAKRHEMQFKESIWTTSAVKVKFLKRDIAIVHVNWSLKGDKDPDGTPRQPRRGIFTRVVTKQNGKWLIVASQNTNIQEQSPTK